MRGPLPAVAVVAIAVACVFLVPRGSQRDGEDAALPLLPSPLDAAAAAEAPGRLATALTFVRARLVNAVGRMLHGVLAH